MLFLQSVWGLYLFIVYGGLLSENPGVSLIFLLVYLIFCLLAQVFTAYIKQIFLYSLLFILLLLPVSPVKEQFSLFFPVLSIPLVSAFLELLHRGKIIPFAPVILLIVPFLSNMTLADPSYWFIALLTGGVHLYERQSQKKINFLKNENCRLTNEYSELKERKQFAGEENKDRERVLVLNERTRLARQIHDDVGHTVTGAIMQLDALELVIKENPEKAAIMASRIKENLSEGMEKIRYILRVIKPSGSTGGIAELRQRLSEFQKNQEIRCSLEVKGDWSGKSSEFWSVCDRNLQEALTNCLKHARADRFSLIFSRLNRIDKVEMKDNGFSRKEIRYGMGLEGMDERVRKAGGTLIVDNSNGFSLIALYPNEQSENSVSGGKPV